MKVYLVTWEDVDLGESDEIGVFSSLEKAQEAKEVLTSEIEDDCDSEYITITPLDLDPDIRKEE